MKNHFNSKKKNIFFSIPWATVGFLFLIVLFWAGISSIQSTSQEQEFQSLEKAIVRSAVHCYAIEGAYPEKLAYLEEHYQLEINHDKFIVHYDIFAQNIVPEITVIYKTE